MIPSRVLFISYNGLLEPLGPTQIVPYVRELSARYRMSILSFEKRVRSSMEDREEQRRLEASLREQGITWVRARYHKHPSLPATLYDIAQGIQCAVAIHAREPIDLVHARGYVPGAIAWGLKRWLGTPYLFDIRGLQAEEYADAGHWPTGGLRFRLTKWAETHILHRADGLVTLTEAIRPALRQFPGLALRPAPPPWEVIPSCADLEHFRFREAGRARIRAELQVGDRPVIVYAGSLGTWYLLDEMLEFYATARRHLSKPFLLILTNAEPQGVRAALQRHRIDETDTAVQWARFEEMPDHLSAADAGLAFIRPCFSKRSSSPTKYAEYLACGLPLVINAGIGDADALVEEGAGVLIQRFDREAYAQGAEALRGLLQQGRGRFRQLAERHFSLANRAAPAYRRFYERILTGRVRKRVLFLTPYPLHCAPSQRLKFEQYYASFEAHGIQVTVSPFVSPALWRILYEPGHWLKKGLFTLSGYFKRTWDFCRASRFDAIYLHLWAVPFGPPWFEEALVRRGIPLVYDIDDLIYLPKASEANLFLRKFRKEARIARIMRAASQVIVSTEYLRRFALRHNPRITRISSTIDTRRYQPRRHSRETRAVTIGWSGSHSTSPYLHLLTPVLQELSRRFDVRVLVVGDATFQMPGVRVEARAWNLERETADLAEMDIGVYPLPDEEWVLGKSGLKALQYMGVGVPVVASRIGAACEFIQDGVNGFLAQTPAEWIERIERLIRDPQLRADMGRAGRQTVETRYSVDLTTPVYLRILREALGSAAPIEQRGSDVAPAREAVVEELVG